MDRGFPGIISTFWRLENCPQRCELIPAIPTTSRSDVDWRISKHLVSTSEKLRGKKPSEYQRFGEPVGSMGLVYVVLFVCRMYI